MSKAKIYRLVPQMQELQPEAHWQGWKTCWRVQHFGGPFLVCNRPSSQLADAAHTNTQAVDNSNFSNEIQKKTTDDRPRGTYAYFLKQMTAHPRVLTLIF